MLQSRIMVEVDMKSLDGAFKAVRNGRKDVSW